MIYYKVSSMKKSESLFTVPELARELKLTERAIRFYEAKGLISPKRLGKTRVFNYKDKARLIIIIRSKKLGFTLNEIKEYLDLYDVDPNHKKQSELALIKIRNRIRKLKDQSKEIKIILTELKQLERQIEKDH